MHGGGLDVSKEQVPEDPVFPDDEWELRCYIPKLLGEKATEWWTTPNPMLGGAVPFDLQDTRPDKLFAFIRAAKEANGD